MYNVGLRVLKNRFLLTFVELHELVKENCTKQIINFSVPARLGLKKDGSHFLRTMRTANVVRVCAPLRGYRRKGVRLLDWASATMSAVEGHGSTPRANGNPGASQAERHEQSMDERRRRVVNGMSTIWISLRSRHSTLNTQTTPPLNNTHTHHALTLSHSRMRLTPHVDSPPSLFLRPFF